MYEKLTTKTLRIMITVNQGNKDVFFQLTMNLYDLVSKITFHFLPMFSFPREAKDTSERGG